MERWTTILWCSVVLALGVALLNFSQSTQKRAPTHTLTFERDAVAQSGPEPDSDRDIQHTELGDKTFAVSIRRPSGPPTIEMTTPDPQGRQGSIACSTCHSVREPNFENRTPADLDQFHQGMPMAHGNTNGMMAILIMVVLHL